MSKTWLIIALILLLAGGVLFTSALISAKFDFSKLGTETYLTNTYTLTDSIESILVHADTEDIRFLPAEDGVCTVVLVENDKAPHTVTVEEGQLRIEHTDTRAWYEHISFSFSLQTPSITVYLPLLEYKTLFVKANTGDVKADKAFRFESIEITVSTGDVRCFASAAGPVAITTSTGDITMENTNAGSLSLSVSTGRITIKRSSCTQDLSVNVSTGKAFLTDITAKNFRSNGSTGDITLTSVRITEEMSITRNTGDVHLNGADAGKIFIKTSTGDVTGTLLSEKVFLTETDTGTVSLPRSTVGGVCEIITDTGDIKIGIAS